MDTFVAILIALIVIALIVLISGLRRVPIGAVGILISGGRRTGQVRGEGTTWVIPWLQQLVYLYVRERQIDIPKANYFTTDRTRIAFKTTLRASLADAAAMFDQGPGTYRPFRREGHGDSESGAEEDNVALRSLVQNGIRECVQCMSIQDVMFGGMGEVSLANSVRFALDSTCKRWGLNVLEVWLTDIDAESPDLKSAVQAQVKSEMTGRAKLAEHAVEVRKGALFIQVAGEMARQIQQETGRAVAMEEVQQFLLAQYHNEQALEVAMKSAGQPGMLQSFYLKHLGMPVPTTPAFPANLGGPGPPLLTGPARGGPVCPGCGNANDPGAKFCDECATPLSGQPAAGGAAGGSWTVGREADIPVSGDGVSRQHCRIELRGGSVVVTDISSNGTFVGDSRLQPNVPTPVERSQRLWLGQEISMSVDELLRSIGR